MCDTCAQRPQKSSDDDRDAQLAVILQASRDAVRAALRRHMLLGESVAVADESGTGVKILGPAEIRKILNET